MGDTHAEFGTPYKSRDTDVYSLTFREITEGDSRHYDLANEEKSTAAVLTAALTHVNGIPLAEHDGLSVERVIHNLPMAYAERLILEVCSNSDPDGDIVMALICSACQKRTDAPAIIPFDAEPWPEIELAKVIDLSKPITTAVRKEEITTTRITVRLDTLGDHVKAASMSLLSDHTAKRRAIRARCVTDAEGAVVNTSLVASMRPGDVRKWTNWNDSQSVVQSTQRINCAHCGETLVYRRETAPFFVL